MFPKIPSARTAHRTHDWVAGNVERLRQTRGLDGLKRDGPAEIEISPDEEATAEVEGIRREKEVHPATSFCITLSRTEDRYGQVAVQWV